jgi:hypothetical protein
VSRLLGLATAKQYPRGERGLWDVLVIERRDNLLFNYDDMKALSDATGSTDINVRYTREEDDYSEYTPGSESDFEIVVWLRMVRPLTHGERFGLA